MLFIHMCHKYLLVIVIPDVSDGTVLHFLFRTILTKGKGSLNGSHFNVNINTLSLLNYTRKVN